MFDIKFKNGNDTFTYTSYNAVLQADAEIQWREYVKKYFNSPCKIVKVVKVLKDLK